MLTGLLTADYQAGSRLCPIPPDFELSSIAWKPNDAQLYTWQKWQNMLEIVPKKLDFYVHLGETLQGPAKKKGSTYELLTNDLNEQIDIAVAMLGGLAERVRPDVQGERHFYICRGSGWHEGEYGRDADLVAKELQAHKFPNGEWSGDILDSDFRGVYCNFSHHSSSFMIYFSTPLERELKFFAESEAQSYTEVAGVPIPIRPDFVARAHSHRPIDVGTFMDGHKVAVTVPGWQLQTRYSMRRSPARAWAPLGFTLVWLDPEAKAQGRRFVWTETIIYPQPKRKALKLR